MFQLPLYNIIIRHFDKSNSKGGKSKGTGVARAEKRRNLRETQVAS